MSLQLTPELGHRLEDLASRTHTSPNDLAESAVEDFVAEHEDLAAAVQEADDEFERGEYLPHDEVVAMFSKRFARA